MSDERLTDSESEEGREPTGSSASQESPEPYTPMDSGAVLEAGPLADPDAIDATLDVEGGANELAVESTSGAESIVGRWRSPAGRLLRTVLAFGAFFIIVAIVWEGFKWVGGDPWRFENILGTGIDYFHVPPFRIHQAVDLQLPHIWDIAHVLTEPVQRRSETTLLVYLIGAAMSTWSQAVVGFALGAIIGVVLASIFVHSRLSERAFMPYVIGSQAIPIIALAPIIVAAVGRGPTILCAPFDGPCISLNVSVIVIATYLTFFPVVIAQSRGLRSPDPRSLELMRSLAASKWDIYRKVRLPASVPYLFIALKVAAAAAIVGAIIGEGPGGVRDGLGRAILNYNQQYVTAPEKLWATILIASLLGVLFFIAVRIAEVLTTRHRRQAAGPDDPPSTSTPAQGT